MFEPLDENLEMRLREGLRAQPVPPVSADLDERVLNALARPEPWWQMAWASFRTAVPAAAGSLVLTLLLAHWAVNPSIEAREPATGVVEAAPVDLDAILAHPDLSRATMLSYRRAERAPKPAAAPDPDVPRRRSDLPLPLA